MCGIAGYIGSDIIDDKCVKRALDLMKNRGPDHQKAIRIQEGSRQVYLLHSRLSIIDIDPRSNQPFERDGICLVFNGEIYNYREIRSELEGLGVKFYTASDTEVLFESYLKWGEQCVDKFEGMWSFAIYDKRDRKLFLSRDRFAEKPLYVFEDGDGIYFGSEIKFIASLSDRRFTVNEQQVSRYLVNGYKSLYKQPQTFFKEIKELSFAQNMIINAEGNVDQYRYWKPALRTSSMSLAEAVEGTRERLFKSMEIRLRSDVPLAFCLSGGVDSASLASVAAKVFNYDVASFSIIDDDERYNESELIKATIDDIGCSNTLIHLEHNDTLSCLKDLVQYHDAPVATISYLVHSYLSKAIHESGYKVAFSGTAADEFFTGYYDHFYLHLYQMRDHADYPRFLSDWQKHISKAVRNPFFKDPELYIKDPMFRQHIYLNNDVFGSYLSTPFNEDFVEKNMAPSLLRSRMMNELFYEATPVILHEDDLNSMKYSVENRSPFLDTELFEFACSIPEEHLIQNGYGKYVLREAMQGVLNDKVRLERKKKGFNASIASVINFNDPKTRDYLLSDSPVYRWVDRDKMIPLFKDGAHEDSMNKFLFSFINVKMFLEQYA